MPAIIREQPYKGVNAMRMEQSKRCWLLEIGIDEFERLGLQSVEA